MSAAAHGSIRSWSASLDRSIAVGSSGINCSPADAEQDTRQAVLDLDSGKRHQLESSQIDRICEAFADVVDAKSHFTFRHSQGVADAAFGIAQAMGLAPDRAQLVRRAALLHDIGKLGVANAILDKKGQLSSEEWEGSIRASADYATDSREGCTLPRDGGDRRAAS